MGYDTIRSILQDQEGNLWFGSFDGASRYDGETWTSFTTKDGLTHKYVWSMLEDREGLLWFGTLGGGVSRYDGQTWTTFTTEDGLSDNDVWSMLQDRDGVLWFGTLGGGVSRYDGQTWTTFTTEEGLGDDHVLSIFQDRSGVFWLGTGDPNGDGGGVTRYDGRAWTTFTTEDGLAENHVMSIRQDREGVLWFGTLGGGVSRYDGQIFQTLTRRDGLGSNAVHSVLVDRAGSMWLGTTGGVTLYQQPVPAPPPVVVEAVVADRRYEDVTEVTIPSTVALTAFEFFGYSFKTRPGAMVYRYRLAGHDEDWRTTRERRVEYEDLPTGRYTFEVLAVDRDLAYSVEPATVDLEIFYKPQGLPVRLEDVQIEDLFASFYTVYADQPVASVVVASDDPQPVDAKLTFFVPGLMQQPTVQQLTLSPQQSQELSLSAVFDRSILDLDAATPFQVEVALSSKVGEQTLSLTEETDVTIHGRGALRWDSVSRAAAFITASDPAVSSFARPSLTSFESEVKQYGRPVGNLVRAMVLFEALKQHGLHYQADANSPYTKVRADRSAVDHVQYPAEVLTLKTGDCDDLTVLYCALLENAGVSTALVDYPGHLFMLFDTGVARQESHKLPIEERLFVERGDRLWIPVEVTLLDQSFSDAWRAGVDELAKLSTRDRRRLVTDTADAWSTYPPTSPTFDQEIAPPQRADYEETLEAQHAELIEMIEDQIDDRYLDPLKSDPDNGALRAELGQLYVALRQYDTAINTAYSHLRTTKSDKSPTYNHLGIVHFFKGELQQAAFQFQQALDLSPDDAGIKKNLQKVMVALGEAEETASEVAQQAGSGETKAFAATIDEDDFYWLE